MKIWAPAGQNFAKFWTKVAFSNNESHELNLSVYEPPVIFQFILAVYFYFCLAYEKVPVECTAKNSPKINIVIRVAFVVFVIGGGRENMVKD
jgi:hypothetical protein